MKNKSELISIKYNFGKRVNKMKYECRIHNKFFCFSIKYFILIFLCFILVINYMIGQIPNRVLEILKEKCFAGIFACESADYAFSLITGPIVFAVDSRGDRSSTHGLAQSGYSVIRSLIMGKPIGHAAVGGSLSLSRSEHPQDLWDKILVRDTKWPFTRR